MVTMMVVFSILGIGCYFDSKKETEEIGTVNVIEDESNNNTGAVYQVGTVTVSSDGSVKVEDNKVFYYDKEITDKDYNNLTDEQQRQLRLDADIH